jgi:hypothetical protein
MPSKEFEEIWKILNKVAKYQEEANKRQDRISQEIDKVNKEIDKVNKEIDKVNKMVGNLTNGWGRFVEGLVAPSIPCIFKKLGIEINFQGLEIKKYKNGKELEIDILCLGKEKTGKDVVIVTEVKSTLTSTDINEFLEDLNKFKEFFYEYKDRKVIGVVTGMRFGKDVQRYAQRCGLYILGPSGEVMKLLNEPSFEPRVW